MGAGQECVRTWRAEVKGQERIHIALPDFSYLIVLAVRDGYVLLWTAFDLEFSHQRKKKYQEWLAYQKQRNQSKKS